MIAIVKIHNSNLINGSVFFQVLIRHFRGLITTRVCHSLHVVDNQKTMKHILILVPESNTVLSCLIW